MNRIEQNRIQRPLIETENRRRIFKKNHKLVSGLVCLQSTIQK